MKRLGCFMLILSILLSLSACGKSPDTEEKVPVVYRFGGNDITYAEYYIYAKTVEENYQKAYGSGVWELELEGDDGKDTVRDITIKDIVSDINRVKVLASHSEALGITLSDNDISEADDTATAFYNGLTEQDIADTGIDISIVKDVIKENMLAEKVYSQMLSEYDFEISDEEARMTTFYDMVFECYNITKDGSVEEYTQEKKAEQLERANEALSSLAQDADVTYDKIVDKYSLEYSSSYTMSKTELIEEYGQSVANKILELSDGEVSVVIETQYGYHIFKMIKANDQELTKKNKNDIISAKQKEYFNGVYEEWLKGYDSHFNYDSDVDMKLAGRFPFEQGESEE